MPNEKANNKKEKLLCVDNLRHAEYYEMQGVFDDLYARSKCGEEFTNLMSLILSRENILLAYRNIKTNAGSKTAGTDGLTISDIGRLTAEQVVDKVRFIAAGSPHGYRPKAVRRKDIPKPYDPTKTRPLGIPCIWDRLIQQCVKQVMEPICEAKFSENSYGFRPGRSTEHAIDRTYRLMQLTHLHYVIEFDIKGFFDNVNHSKLIKQIWAMGIHDKHLLYILRQMLSATIKMPDGTFVRPNKGTPQGGIISPLLANIVLNELDHWIDSQWQDIKHEQHNVIVTQFCVIVFVQSLQKDLYFLYFGGLDISFISNFLQLELFKRIVGNIVLFCCPRKQSMKILVGVIESRRTGFGNVGEVFQDFNLQDIHIQGILGLLKEFVDVLFVVAQRSLTNLLSLFQGKKLIGDFSQSSVITDHFHSHTLHLTICQNRRLRSIF